MQTKQVYKGKTLTRTKVKNNILRVFALANEDQKRNWYNEANEFAQTLETSITKACGVIAAMSPMKTWEQNLKLAEDMVRDRKAGHMGAFVKKANDILDSDGSTDEILRILNGNKIKSFYLNILHPSDNEHVTIDRHAIRIALYKPMTDDEISFTDVQYKFFADCYKLAAKEVGITPSLMQSATWVVARQTKMFNS